MSAVVDIDELADAIVERLAPRLDTRPLLSVKAAAERLGLSERKVREMIALGTLPSLKVEGSRRIEPAAIDRYLAAQR